MKLLRSMLIYSWIAMIALHSAGQVHALCEETTTATALQQGTLQATTSIYASSDNLPALQTEPSQWSISTFVKKDITSFGSALQSISVRIWSNTTARRILSLHGFSRGLDVTSIIFPFHVFW